MSNGAGAAKTMSGPPHSEAARLLEKTASLLRAGRIVEAVPLFAPLERAAWSDARILQHVGEFYTHTSRNTDAERVYRRAVALAPNDPACLYNFSTALIAVGKFDEAESALDAVIARAPTDYDAYYNRATLRRQTRERNHIAELSAIMAKGTQTPAGEVQIGYALAKELEDLGDDASAFAYLKRGADRRRALLSYKVEGDVETMARLAQVFDAARLRHAPAAVTAPGPIFVTGLPRSGTTLVDRILSSHSDVDSLGEIADFAQALMQVAGPAKGRNDLIDRSAQLDHATLGRAYLERTQSYTRQAPFLIDKTPLNFLYAGLIALALPNARIVHVRRGAMDVCYAMYKTLFRMGYPFSYDFDDLARYYVAYDKLMAHWRTAMPGRIVEIGYEALIADQETQTRALVAACGLGWQDACLEFHRNDAPVSTASAAQARRPIYASSVSLWRRYERELAPLAERLTAAGIPLEAAP